MRSKHNFSVKKLIIVVFIVVAIAIAAVMFWPIRCDDLMDFDGDLVIYNTTATLTYNSDGSVASITGESYVIPADSDEYDEILQIMSNYYCHRKIGNIDKHNFEPWILIYSTDNLLCYLDYSSTADIAVNYLDNTYFDALNYTVYGGAESAQEMMNAIIDVCLSNPSYLNESY